METADPDREVVPLAGGASRSPTLGQYLVPLVALAVFPFVALLVVAMLYAYANLRATIETNLLSQVRVLAALVDNELDMHIAAARVLGVSPALRDGDLAGFDDEMRAALREFPDAVGLLLDDDARVRIATAPLPPGARPRSMVPALHVAVRRDNLAQASDLVRGALPPDPVVVVAAPIRADSPLPGTVAINIGVARFHALIEGKFPETTVVAVVDRQDRFLARLPDGEAWVGREASESFRHALATGAAEGVFNGYTVDGQRTLSGFARTRHGWAVGVGYPAAQLEGPLRRLRTSLAVAGLAALALSIVLAAWVRRRIGDAARRLLASAAALRANRVPPDRPTGIREYDEVAQTLARAGTALRDRAAMLAASEARYRELSDAMPQLVWTADAAGRLNHYNRQRVQYHGAAGDPSDWTTIVHPDDMAQTREVWEQALARGAPYEMEHRLRLADGRWHWHLSRAVPQRDADGRVSHWIGTATDVDANKRRENEAEYLLREVNHRSKNLLAIAQAMTRQTVMDEAPEEVAEALCARFAALASSQDLMLRGEWRRVPVEALVRVQLAHFAPLIGGRIRVAGPGIRLNASAAQAIGMALHELATNATKYGALGGEAGEVAVTWRLAEAAEPRFEMEWEESGGPPVAQPVRAGFGQFVMVRMVEQTLGGEVALEFRPGGIAWRLRAPAVAALEETPSPPPGGDAAVSTSSP